LAVEIHVPELGESVADATVGRWLKQEGETVKSGEALVELETDKINFEVEAEQDGVLESIAKGEGETVGVGEVIGSIGEGEAGGDGSKAPTEKPEKEEAAAQEERAETEQPEAEAEGVADEEADGHREVENGVRASPSVRKLAQEYDIDLAEVAGSGSSGRVTREDVERLIRGQDRGGGGAPTREAEKPPAPEEDGRREAAPAEDGLEERVRLSRRRLTIAQRLVESQQNSAMLTTFNEADMSAVMELRRRRKDAFQERTGARLGFMSFFTKAAVAALKAFPKVNAELQDNELVLKHYYDIGVAVSTDREGKLTLEDLRGGTFTITNGGIFGSLVSTPILTLPQVAILGMHKIQDRPVAVDGKVEVRPMMYLALSYDHRVIDGAEAVSFLVRIKEMIEDPESLLLEG
jgi:2-oxoglutarate dehydrogenase E2 component (dihydrolipoamide succinyltransferase)